MITIYQATIKYLESRSESLARVLDNRYTKRTINQNLHHTGQSLSCCCHWSALQNRHKDQQRLAEKSTHLYSHDPRQRPHYYRYHASDHPFLHHLPQILVEDILEGVLRLSLDRPHPTRLGCLCEQRPASMDHWAVEWHCAESPYTESAAPIPFSFHARWWPKLRPALYFSAL